MVATGDGTEVGHVSEMISSAEQIATPLTRKIAAFTRLLLWVILAVAASAFAAGVARGDAAIEMFKAAVALAVGGALTLRHAPAREAAWSLLLAGWLCGVAAGIVGIVVAASG